MKQYYSYKSFKRDVNTLLTQVESFDTEVIVGLARGGLTLSHALAEGMNLREVQILRTEFYDKNSKRESLSFFGSCDFANKKRVLVVDDISDSGETLVAIMKYLQENFKDVEFKVATLFYKKTSKYEPHFWINEANCWIDFFWEVDFKKS